MSTDLRPLLPRTRNWGIALAAITAVVSGVAVWINGYGVSAWKDAGASTATYTTAKNLIAAAALGALAYWAARRRPAEGLTRPASRRQWLGLVVVGVVGGSVPFLLFFEGLSRASSPQAAFIHKTLVVWVLLLAVPILGERIGALHVAAIAILVSGQVALIGGVSEVSFGAGEAMILAATVLWAVELIVAKRLLADLSPLTVANARMGLGVVVLVAYGLLSGGLTELAAIGVGDIGWILLTGATLTAYVATWYQALARAQAVDVTAVLVFGAVVTAALRSGVSGAAFPSATGLVLLTIGGAAALLAGARRPDPT